MDKITTTNLEEEAKLLASSNFIKDFTLLAQGTEIPETFMFWCGISAVSMTLGRRVSVNMGTFTIYPNLYIVLVASSGRCRKSTAIDQFEKLASLLDPPLNLISQRITPEGLIDALRMKGNLDEGEDASQEKKKKSWYSQGAVIVDELSNFLNKKTYEAGLASLLISLFDCKESFEYRTKGRGVEKIQKACLSLLGASTVDWLRQAIPLDAIGGGLTSRIIFVYNEKIPPPVPRPWLGGERSNTRTGLLLGLQRLQTLNGEFSLTDKAWKLYEELYIDFYHNSVLFLNPGLSGYASRRFVHLLKLAMVFSACDSNSLIIKKHHVQAADFALLEIEPQMPKVLDLLMATDEGSLREVIYQRIKEKGKISYSRLHALMSHKASKNEIHEHLETLIVARKIEMRSDGKEHFIIAL